MTSIAWIENPPAATLLFGAGNLGAASRRGYTVDVGPMIVWLMIAAGVIAAICLAVFFASRAAHLRRCNNHGSLFTGLCRLYGLDGGSRRLLRQLAAQHNLAQPARLFTEPRWFNPAALPPLLVPHMADVASLYQRLFADES